MKKIIFLFCAALLLAGCESTSCEDYACFTPPPNIVLELLDSDTKENLFSNGTFDPSQIRVASVNGEPVEFMFITEDGLNVINTSLGWDTENTEYQLMVGEVLTIDLVVNTERRSEDCCTYYELLDFDIPDYKYERSESTGLFSIYVETAAEQ